jgi:hypothetical protein
LKLRLPWKWDELRQKLLLTREEKRVIIFILAAIVLGLGTKCYRDKHPPPPLPDADAKQRWGKHAAPPPSPARKSSRKPRKKLSPSVTPTVSEDLESKF